MFAQVGRLVGRPNFQAGHTGSIPVIRSQGLWEPSSTAIFVTGLGIPTTQVPPDGHPHTEQPSHGRQDVKHPVCMDRWHYAKEEEPGEVHRERYRAQVSVLYASSGRLGQAEVGSVIAEKSP